MGNFWEKGGANVSQLQDLSKLISLPRKVLCRLRSGGESWALTAALPIEGPAVLCCLRCGSNGVLGQSADRLWRENKPQEIF
jgi:hypothetical protein